MRDYGKLLKEYRNENGINQKELAALLGVTQPFISQLEQERVEIFAESLREKVEELLGIQEEASDITAEDILETAIRNVEKKRAASNPPEEIEEDMIHSPKHYQIPGCDFESIDLALEIVADLPGKLGAVVFNVVKYLVRAEKKDGRRDYEKCRKYLTWAIKHRGDQRGCFPEEVAEALGTDWITIIAGICEGLPMKKALLMNEIFKCVIGAEYEDAIHLLDKFLEA